MSSELDITIIITLLAFGFLIIIFIVFYIILIHSNVISIYDCCLSSLTGYNLIPSSAGNLSGNTDSGNSGEMWSKQSTNKNISNSTSNNRLNDDGLLATSNTLRYNWETFGEEPDNSFGAQHGRGAASNNINAQTQMPQPSSILTNPNEEFSFRTVHEAFKKIILDDINEYRKRKENSVKPLIEL